MGMMDESDQSSAVAATTPFTFVSGLLNIVNAYTEPSDMCTPNAGSASKYLFVVVVSSVV